MKKEKIHPLLDRKKKKRHTHRRRRSSTHAIGAALGKKISRVGLSEREPFIEGGTENKSAHSSGSKEERDNTGHSSTARKNALSAGIGKRLRVP